MGNIFKGYFSFEHKYFLYGTKIYFQKIFIHFSIKSGINKVFSWFFFNFYGIFSKISYKEMIFSGYD